jgi:hypothetical protein
MKLGQSSVAAATAEDLIVLKTLADRSIDRRDIEELIELYGSELDFEYINKTLAEITRSLE